MSDKSICLLLIEDSPDDIQLIREFMAEDTRFRAELSVATCLSEARARLAQQEIDLVLLDLSLPDSSGLDTLLRLQRIAPHTPIVVLTDFADEESSFDLLSRGAQDCLEKGDMDGRLLRRAIRYAIERKQMEERLWTTLAQAEILYRTGQSLITFEDLSSLLQMIVDNVAQTLLADHVALVTVDFEKRSIRHFVKGGKGSQHILSVPFEELWNGLSGWVLREGQPALSSKAIPDPRESPEAQRRRLETDCGSIIVVPLIYRSELLGTMTAINRPDERDFTQHDIELMQTIASQAVTALQNVQLFAAEHDQRVFAEALSGTTSILTSTLDINVVMKRLLASVGQVVPHDAADIMLIEGNMARVTSWVGYPPSVDQAFQKGFTLSLETGTLQDMFTTGKTTVVPDTALCAEWAKLTETAWIRSYIGVPIQAHNQVIGFLNLDSKIPNFFTQIHAERLQAFADQAAIALENAQLYNEIQNHAAELEQRVRERTAELNHAKERVEAILNNSSDLIILLNNEGVIQQVNPIFDKTYHCEPGQSIGEQITSLAAPDSAGPLIETLRATVEYQRPQRLEIVAQYNGSIAFDADVAFSPIVQENGQVSGVVCSLRDITLLKQSEANLRQMLTKETELSEMKSRFINTASHEFRTPLAIIQACSDSLRRYDDRLSEEKKLKKFDQIQVSVKNITTLLDDVLAISQAQEGKLEFNPIPLDLETFCREMLDDFEKLYNGEHTFIFSWTGSQVNASLDPKLLGHIIGNLLSNAAKYSPSGSTVLFDLRVQPDQAVFRIQDEGIGIPQADQARLFEPFHRAHNVGTIRGNGLGLAIVKQAVDLHSGTISVESVEGAGTTFTVMLPL